jgi:hypothetical protein
LWKLFVYLQQFPILLEIMREMNRKRQSSMAGEDIAGEETLMGCPSDHRKQWDEPFSPCFFS